MLCRREQDRPTRGPQELNKREFAPGESEDKCGNRYSAEPRMTGWPHTGRQQASQTTYTRGSSEQHTARPLAFSRIRHNKQVHALGKRRRKTLRSLQESAALATFTLIPSSWAALLLPRETSHVSLTPSLPHLTSSNERVSSNAMPPTAHPTSMARKGLFNDLPASSSWPPPSVFC